MPGNTPLDVVLDRLKLLLQRSRMPAHTRALARQLLAHAGWQRVVEQLRHQLAHFVAEPVQQRDLPSAILLGKGIERAVGLLRAASHDACHCG